MYSNRPRKHPAPALVAGRHRAGAGAHGIGGSSGARGGEHPMPGRAACGAAWFTSAEFLIGYVKYNFYCVPIIGPDRYTFVRGMGGATAYSNTLYPVVGQILYRMRYSSLHMARRELFSDRYTITLSVGHWQELTGRCILNQEAPNVKT